MDLQSETIQDANAPGPRPGFGEAARNDCRRRLAHRAAGVVAEDQHTQYFVAAPLGLAGRCRGHFRRSWIGIATFDPVGSKSVKIIQKPATRFKKKARRPGKARRCAFEPTCAFTLQAPTGERRVVVGRKTRNGSVNDHPLIVDPDAKSVTVMPEPVWSQSFANAQARDGSVYFVHFQVGKRDLARIDFPGKIVPSGLTNVPEGVAIVLGDDVLMRTMTHGISVRSRRMRFVPLRPNNMAPAEYAVGMSMDRATTMASFTGAFCRATTGPSFINSARSRRLRVAAPWPDKNE